MKGFISTLLLFVLVIFVILVFEWKHDGDTSVLSRHFSLKKQGENYQFKLPTNWSTK